MARNGGNKFAREVKRGLIIKNLTVLNDYYPKWLQSFVENNAEFQHLERPTKAPQFLVKRGGNRGYKRSNYRPKRQDGATNRNNFNNNGRRQGDGRNSPAGRNGPTGRQSSRRGS